MQKCVKAGPAQKPQEPAKQVKKSVNKKCHKDTVDGCYEMDIAVGDYNWDNQAQGMVRLPYKENMELGIHNPDGDYAIYIAITDVVGGEPLVDVELYYEDKESYLQDWGRNKSKKSKRVAIIGDLEDDE